MPAPLTDLERGAICLALYPFTPGFPIDLVLRAEDEITAQLDQVDSIEQVAATIQPGDAPEVVAEVKLRPVLLLQTGTSTQREDVLVARISSISDDRRARQPNWVLKLENGIHPVMALVGHQEHHGLRQISYVNTLTIQPVAKAAILRRVGSLDEDEMRDITDRLIRALELDISAYVRALGGEPSEENEETSAGSD